MPATFSHPHNTDTVHSCVPKSQKPCCPGFPLLLLKFFLPKLINSAWVCVWYVVISVTTRAPLISCLSRTIGLLHWFMLLTGLIAKHRPAVSQCLSSSPLSLIMFIITITYHLIVRDSGFLRAMGFLPKYITLPLPSVSAHCTLA